MFTFSAASKIAPEIRLRRPTTLNAYGTEEHSAALKQVQPILQLNQLQINYQRCVPRQGSKVLKPHDQQQRYITNSFSSFSSFTTFNSEATKNNLPLAFYDISPATKTILIADASLQGLDGVLTQVQDGIERPVYFISGKLQPGETKYLSSELETLTVLVGLLGTCINSVWGVLLKSKRITLICDKCPLAKSRDLWHQLELSDGRLDCCPATSLFFCTKGHTNHVEDGGSSATVIYDISLAAIKAYAVTKNSTLNDDAPQKVVQFSQAGWPSKPAILDCSLPF